MERELRVLRVCSDARVLALFPAAPLGARTAICEAEGLPREAVEWSTETWKPTLSRLDGNDDPPRRRAAIKETEFMVWFTASLLCLSVALWMWFALAGVLALFGVGFAIAALSVYDKASGR